jgi:hypothetical protein
LTIGENLRFKRKRLEAPRAEGGSWKMIAAKNPSAEIKKQIA